MTDARVWAEYPDGTRVDVTEGVQVVYDLVLGGMDFGSGFLAVEEVIPLAELAEACGFDDAPARSYIKSVTKHLYARGERPDRAQIARDWLASHPIPKER